MLTAMACPYFMPTETCGDLWPHPARLPLSGCWTGQCTAPGHEGTTPSNEELKSGCNLGYARCGRLPADRAADAVRFLVRERNGFLSVQYVFEIAHRPAAHGTLQFNKAAGQWVEAHPDQRIQRMADCLVQLKRRAAASH